jgi:outer membrane protein TolC
MNRLRIVNFFGLLPAGIMGLSLFFTTSIIGQLPMTLEMALEIAETGSPSIKRSLYNVDQVNHNLKAERASLKSRFSLTLEPYSFSNNRVFNNQFSQWFTNTETFSRGTFQVEQPILRTGGSVGLFNTFGWRSNKSAIANLSENSNRAFSNNLYLTVNQPLFTYNRRQMALDELELNYENANLSYAIQRLTLEKTITSQFFDVYLAQLNLDISREELENTSKNYEIVKLKVEASLLAKEELYQAELNFANAQLSIQDNELALENAEELFKREIGMNLDEDIQLVTELDAQAVLVDLERAVKYALDSRLELRQRRIDIEKTFFEMERTKSMNEFRADVQLILGIFGDNESLGNLYQSPTSSPTVGLSLNIPIWDWGERNERVQAVEVSMQSQRLDLKEDQKQIRMDIRSAFRSVQTQMPRIEIARKNVENAERTYDINLERYLNGDLSGIDLNQFQTQLSTKKIDLARALINYKSQLLDLKILTLYDWEKQEAVSLALRRD